MKYASLIIALVIGSMTFSCQKYDRELLRDLKKSHSKYDCPDLKLNHGDHCTTRDNKRGTITKRCTCEADSQSRYDCPKRQANYGDKCKTKDNKAGTINRKCECEADSGSRYDCPNIQANYGDKCVTRNNKHGYINKKCDCVEK